MKVFDNLRKRIVHKLIRPEDGYIHTGIVNGKPIKLYHDLGTGKYMLGMQSEHGYFSIPTLTGWADGWEHMTTVKEIEFPQWIYGVLSNVRDEYSERLDNLSRYELKNIRDYKRQEKGDGFVITKNAFCDIMDALDKYWVNLRALEDVLNVYFDSGMLADIFDKVVEALEDEMEPNLGPHEELLISRWLIEFDAGRDEKAKEGVDGHSLTTAEELYDYLVWKRNDRALRDAVAKEFEKAESDASLHYLKDIIG